MRSFYEDSGLSRIALGLQNRPRAFLRKARPSDLDADGESTFAAHKWRDARGTIGLGAAASTFTQIAEARFAGLVAEVRAPATAPAEPATADPVVLLGSVPSAAVPPNTIGSSTPPPAVAAICGCGYFLAPTQVLDQMAANAAHVHLSGQMNVSGGADFLLTGQTGVMGASVSADISLQNVAPIKDWQLVGGVAAGSETGQVGVMSGSVTSATASSSTTTSSSLTAAATSTNKVVLENQKQGTPQSVWDIDGAGSSNIEGFATDISVDVGNRVDFKINTNSSNYRIEIYRLGYYGGMGARLVDTIQHTGVQNQPAPLRDATTGLVDAGNWSVSASWNIPADSVSGVYIAKLVRQDGTFGENHIPFIVRDDSSTSDIIFQTSDTTWQAYNGWGGANFYGGNGPATGQGAGRAYAVSYNRPIATRGNVGTAAGAQDYLFGAEYSAIYWLEQNGYDVSYMAGVDADRYGSLLLNHKMYLDVGHDEYWSGQQRANVQAARDAGVNLSFWSGNEMYWRTRWGDSISNDATSYRTLISYKETWANSSIDPTDQWTGTFRDPRFSPPATGGGIPENALIGQMFQVDDVGVTQADALQAITIPYDDSNLRFWRNTSVANLQPGQTASLTKNYLGYEWDEALDNGFDPAGLVRLSSTTLPVSTYLLDYGNTVGSHVSTHNLTLYRAPSGALVFGAGTVYWSWGLSDNHDLQPTPSDPRVQQAMVNLLADMGIQPGTLQSGLTPTTASTDTTAPTSNINSIASFSAQTVVTISGTAADLGGGVIGAVEVSTDGGVTWNNAIGDENWTYTWSPQVAGTYTIKSRAVDDFINLESPSGGRTVVVTAPSYVTLFSGSSTPAIVNATDLSAVELGVKFQASISGTVTGIRFYKSSMDTGTHTGELWSSAGALLATATFTNETASGWQSVTFSSPVTLTPNTTYVASYHTNVGHYSVNPNYFTSNVTSGPLTAVANGNGVYTYGSNTAFPSNTYSGENYWVDVMFNPSTVNGLPVAANDVGPTIAQNLAATIAASSLTNNDSDPDGDALSVVGVSAAAHGSVVLNTQSNPQNNTITFTPDSGYTGLASFSYTISDGRGGTATANVSFTVAPAGAAPVSLFSASSTPAQTSLDDGQQLEVGVKFTSSVSGQITALKFYRSASDTGADIVDLWTATGTLLGSATFTNTAASGWQTVNLPSAVSISANTTYVASYHTTGGYVATNNYFTTAVASGPLTAPSTTTIAGGNGVYSYGGTSTTGIFPTNTYGAANYWVDVVFTPSGGASNIAPTAAADAGDATEKGGANNLTGGAAATGNVLTNDTDPDAGDTKSVSGVSFGATAGTLGAALTGVHGSLVLGASGAFTYTVNETDPVIQALRLSTNTVADVFSYTMRDAAGGTSTATLTITIHGANDAPLLTAQTGPQGASVGSAFTLTIPAGTFTDVDTGETLTYSASAGNPAWLTFNPATRTFSGTPTSAGTFNVGVSVIDAGGLAAGETFNIVVSASNAPPTAAADVGDATERGGINNGTVGVAASGNVLTNDTDPDSGDTKTVSAVSSGSTAGTVGASLTGAHGSLVLSASGTYTYTVNETDSAVQALRLSTNTITDLFNYTMRDSAGATSQATLTITIHGANDAPILTAQTANRNTTVGSTFLLALPANTFTDVDSGDSLTYTATASDGSVLPGWLNFDAATRTFSGTPTSTGTFGVKVSVADLGGLTASETFNIVVTPLTVSLFSSSDTPAILSDSDTSQVNLGVRFTSSSVGTITGIKYYKGANDTGTHTGSLWSSTGALLATATFTNETASGWQTVTFSSPVTISAGTTYVASYHSNGHYTATGNYFTTARVNGPLTAPASGNGVYAYGSGNLFPSSTYGAANYWVDVMFSPASGGTNQAPVAANDTGFNVAPNSSISIAASTLLANDTDTNGDPLTITGASNGVNGTASFNAQSNTVTFVPNSGYAGPASFTYAVSDGRGGTATASVSLAVNAASTNIVSLFSSSSAPLITAVNDPNSVELGLKFQAFSSGEITGLSFYKGASNTGTHVANLWTSTGTLLATTTFTNETATGWQQVNFATPVPITAGTTYVASYHTSGNYAADPGLFNSAVPGGNGLLTAPSSASSGGNGVYAYGSSSLFPTNSYNSTSYGVDVLFRQLVA